MFALIVFCRIYQQWIKDKIIGHAALVCFMWYPVAALYLRHLFARPGLTNNIYKHLTAIFVRLSV